MKRQCVALLCAVALGAGGCHAMGKGDYGWIGGPQRAKEGKGALRVRWRRELTPAARGAYRPVENAVAAIDPVHARVYVGARSGELHALRLDGTPLYHFELHEPIESEPALDVEKDELYVANERSELFGLKPSTGEIRWKASTAGAVRRKPVLFKDAVYVVTEEDSVEALSRADGSRLWSYRRDRGDGFLVAGHAGLRLSDDGLIYAAFNDGMVVALDALDGRARWERSTAEDVPDADPGRPRYVDVDATPVRLGDHVFAASFAGGLYCLDARNGSVVWREAGWTGITGMELTADGALILVSGDHGVVRFEPAQRQARWIKALERGSLGTPQVASNLVLIGDSRGSLFALHVGTGDELGRIESGHGFAARAAVEGRHGFVVTNGGVLLALRVQSP